jgi:hypothetical protein
MPANETDFFERLAAIGIHISSEKSLDGTNQDADIEQT